ncbi:MAG: ABC transporter ATP-binding protein, partial [Myxococcota bacterium]
MIEVKRLTKTYGNISAVRDVSFEVGAHEVVGFLGPNGAGKTTTLRIIAGFLGASQGKVVVDGLDIVDEPIRARTRIGYMPENVPLYPELRVGEYLRFRAELKRVPRGERKAAVARAMRDVRIDDHESVIIGHLSKGYRQRVGLADAIVSRPAALVLDEPTAGLDPNQIREVRELIRSLAKQHAVLLSTHIMSEVEATCDRALVIDRGRLVAQGTLGDLRKLRRSNATRFALRGDADRALEVLQELQGSRAVQRTDDEDEDVFVLDVRWSPKSDP